MKPMEEIAREFLEKLAEANKLLAVTIERLDNHEKRANEREKKYEERQIAEDGTFHQLFRMANENSANIGKLETWKDDHLKEETDCRKTVGRLKAQVDELNRFIGILSGASAIIGAALGWIAAWFFKK